MKSELPKVLLPLLDEPVLFYSLSALEKCRLETPGGLASIAAVVGHKGELVQDYLASEWPEVVPIWQHQQLGTGHAVQIAREWWSAMDHLLVLPGDVPLLSGHTLSRLVEEHVESGADCSFISFHAANPAGYGRVVRKESAVSIVEEKDATEEQKLLSEVNSGIYIFRVASLLPHIYRLDNENAQGEYYLPDIISMMVRSGMKVNTTPSWDEEEFMGINTTSQLASAVSLIRRRIVEKCLAEGVRMADPESVWIGAKATIEKDVYLAPSVQIWGRSCIGSGSSVGSFSILRDAVLEQGVEVISHVSLTGSTVRGGARLGPFCVVRDGAVICEGALVGKFVEVKKSVVGKGSKVPHLSYMGDASVGEGANVGAGTITCNFDGEKKNPTVIGSRAFIGSDTMLVAPVSVGEGAFTAAGSVITQNVPDGALAVGRARQKNIEGWVNRRGKRKMEGDGNNGVQHA